MTQPPVPQEGSLAQTPLSELLAGFAHAKVSGRLHVSTSVGEADVNLFDGAVVEARFGPAQGETALLRLLSFTEGRFRLESHGAPPGGVTSGELADILDKASAHRAEVEKHAANLGGLSEVFSLDLTVFSRRTHDVPPEIGPVLRLLDGRRSVLDILAMTELPDVTVLRVLRKLRGMGLLRTATELEKELREAEASREPPSPAVSAPPPPGSIEEMLLAQVSQRAADRAAVLDMVFPSAPGASHPPPAAVDTARAALDAFVGPPGSSLVPIPWPAGGRPVEAEKPAATTTEPPVAVSEPAATTVEPPVTATEPPAKPTEPPVTATEVPATPSEPPVAATEVPAKPSEPPVAATEPPAKPTESPVAATEVPAKPSEPPVAATEVPAKPVEPPVAVTETPATLAPPAPAGPLPLPLPGTQAPVAASLPSARDDGLPTPRSGRPVVHADGTSREGAAERPVARTPTPPPGATAVNVGVEGAERVLLKERARLPRPPDQPSGEVLVTRWTEGPGRVASDYEEDPDACPGGWDSANLVTPTASPLLRPDEPTPSPDGPDLPTGVVVAPLGLALAGAPGAARSATPAHPSGEHEVAFFARAADAKEMVALADETQEVLLRQEGEGKTFTYIIGGVFSLALVAVAAMYFMSPAPPAPGPPAAPHPASAPAVPSVVPSDLGATVRTGEEAMREIGRETAQRDAPPLGHQPTAAELAAQLAGTASGEPVVPSASGEATSVTEAAVAPASVGAVAAVIPSSTAAAVAAPVPASRDATPPAPEKAAPAPQPAPAVKPTPEPKPAPQPAPADKQTPEPKPAPQPAPEAKPAPEPKPKPAPEKGEGDAPAKETPNREAAAKAQFAALYDKGLKHLEAQRYDEARRAFESARKVDPSDARAYASLGQVHYEAGNLDLALQQLRRAETLNRNYAATFLVLGLVHQENGELDAAEKAFERFLALEPAGPNAKAVQGFLKALRQRRAGKK
jgi:TolA-binding protein